MKSFLFLIFVLFTLTLSFKYDKPDIFPYKSLEEFKKQTKSDPFGIDYSSYKYSLETVKKIQAEPDNGEVISIGSFSQGMKTFKQRDENNAILTVSSESAYLYGVVNLEDFSEIESVECNKINELIVKTSHINNIKEWIPGSRFIVSEKFTCSKIKNEPRVFFINKRQAYQQNIIVYEVEEMGMLDTFSYISLDAVRETEKSPSGQIKVGLFNFNYDSKNRCVLKPNIDIYRDRYFSFVCKECYSFIEADILFGFKFSWKQGITYQKTEIIGYTESVYRMFADANYDFSKEFVYDLFKLPNAIKIRFSIGPVPVWIDFDLLLQFKANIAVTAGASLEFGSKFWDKLTLGMTFNKDLPKGSQFNFYKNNTHSDFKELIPYPEVKASFDFKGTAFIIPEVTVRFFSTCAVRLGALPYLYTRSNADLKLPTDGDSCPVNQLYFQLDFGVNWYIQMMVLKFLNFKSTLGGLLPYPNPTKEFVLVPQKNIFKQCLKIVPK
jgi:hypothetical protein